MFSICKLSSALNTLVLIVWIHYLKPCLSVKSVAGSSIWLYFYSAIIPWNQRERNRTGKRRSRANGREWRYSYCVLDAFSICTNYLSLNSIFTTGPGVSPQSKKTVIPLVALQSKISKIQHHPWSAEHKQGKQASPCFHYATTPTPISVPLKQTQASNLCHLSRNASSKLSSFLQLTNYSQVCNTNLHCSTASLKVPHSLYSQPSPLISCLSSSTPDFCLAPCSEMLWGQRLHLNFCRSQKPQFNLKPPGARGCTKWRWDPGLKDLLSKRMRHAQDSDKQSQLFSHIGCYCLYCPPKTEKQARAGHGVRAGCTSAMCLEPAWGRKRLQGHRPPEDATSAFCIRCSLFPQVPKPYLGSEISGSPLFYHPPGRLSSKIHILVHACSLTVHQQDTHSILHFSSKMHTLFQ